MDQITTDTYNRSAQAYADKFSVVYDIRSGNIRKALDLYGKSNPVVLELGCGDGQGAEVICQMTDKYTGLDISTGLLQIAKNKNIVNAKFELVDMESYKFNEPLDMVFAFGSLLHLDKESVAKVLKKVHTALSKGGLFYLSLKEGKYSGPENIKDDYGERVFYYYMPEQVKELVRDYEMISLEKMKLGKTVWMNVSLKKI